MRFLLLMFIAGCSSSCNQPEEEIIGDPTVIAHIERWNSWLEPVDLESKYCKMSQSPFAFFRGTAHLYWLDLGNDPRLRQFGRDRTKTWLQGDSHVQNFGSFNNDQDEVVYDLNDFDEAVIGDYQLDVWRLAISIILMAGEEDEFNASDVNGAIDAMTEAYLDELDKLEEDDGETTAEFKEGNTQEGVSEFLDDVKKENDRVEMLEKWTDYDIGELRLDTNHEDLEPVTATEEASILDDLDTYLDSLSGGLDPAELGTYFDAIDIARRRNQGLGSLGVPRYYVLIEGEDPDDEWDDRILDIKLQRSPAASEAFPELANAAPDFQNHAVRVATGQKALALHVDDHLGHMISGNEAFSVRERSPWKEALDIDEIEDTKLLNGVASDWGKILANAHARADEDFSSGSIDYNFDREVEEITDGEHEEFRDLVRSVARPYSQQVEQGWLAFEDFVDTEFDFECDEEEDDG